MSTARALTSSSPSNLLAMPDLLRFGCDQEPGIRRAGVTRIRYFHDSNDEPATGSDRERIRALAIPPAWTQVWIAADRLSHLQATGRDARGRKQYIYHRAFTSSRAESKFADLVAFGLRLGPLRRRVSCDLARNDLGEDRVVATIVRLMDITSLRIGNIGYATTNKSFGLTTLRNEHVAVRGTTIQLSFRGKSAHDFDVSVDNAQLAKIVRRCQDLPGQQLFEYRSKDGEILRIGSNHVNRYLADHAGVGVTAKTFRTWNATVRATDGLAAAIQRIDTPTTRVLNEVLDSVAEHLGNTRAVCRNSYVHPAVVESYTQGTLLPNWRRSVSSKPTGLTVVERKALRFLSRIPASPPASSAR